MSDLVNVSQENQVAVIAGELGRVKVELESAEAKYKEAAEVLVKSESSFKFPVWAIVVGLFFYLFPGIIMLVLNLAVFNKKKKALEDEALEIAGKGDDILNAIQSNIPQKYLFLTCIDYAIELSNTGRANTLPELYDRLDEQLHRWTLEAQNDTILASQLAMNEQMGRAATNSGIAAAASVLNLFI